MKNSAQITVVTILILILLSSCSSQKKLANKDLENGTYELVVPPGVDSTIAAQAFKIGNESFVSVESEEKAEELKETGTGYINEGDRIWTILKNASQNDSTASAKDKENPEFIEFFNQGADYLIELRNIENQVSEEINQKRYAELIDLAVNAFENAIALNPFDSETKLLLGQLYGLKASRLNEVENFESAINILEKLVLIEKGDHIIYSVLAENYYLTKNYQMAIKNFEIAGKVFLETVELSDYYYDYGEMSEQDSTTIFTYQYYLGLSYTNLYDPINAIISFEDAKRYSTNSDQTASIESELDYINWDDGNIIASEFREKAVSLVNLGQLAEAEKEFIDLYKRLNTTKAKDEIQWRLAVVEYQLGKVETAADRLLKLVQRTETEADGSPTNPQYSNYFYDFGIITYNIGLQQLSNKNRPLALSYLLQSSKIKWDQRARSNLRIADLLFNNIQESLKHALLAESEIQTLSQTEVKSLYRLLSELYRRSGNMNEARKYFAIWRGIST